MRKQLSVVAMFMLLFAGLGSSAVLSNALAQQKPLSAIEQAKRLGPRPTPRWYWRWQAWRLGEGYAKGHALQRSLRPKQAPHRIPAWAWQRLHLLRIARDQRTLAAAKKGQHGSHTTTTSTTTTSTTTTTTTATTTTATTTTGTTTTTSSSSDTYDQAIAYSQSRPAFTASRVIDVSSASQLLSAISNLQAGDLVRATASFTVSGETVIKNRLSAPAELDLAGVHFVYSGGQELPAVWLNNAQNVWIFGGDASTADTGGSCIMDYGSQHVLWWGFTAHDCGGCGFASAAINGPVDHNDFQGTIWKVGQHLAWDNHLEKGSGLHGVNLWDGNYPGNFTNNRFAFSLHDIPTGACVEVGNVQTGSLATGNVLYEKCVNATFVSTIQTGGNALQLWGDTNTLGLDVKYLEANNLQGYALFDDGVYSGQTLSGVTIDYGRATNTNLNPLYTGKNPWQTNKGVVYQDVSPAP